MTLRHLGFKQTVYRGAEGGTQENALARPEGSLWGSSLVLESRELTFETRACAKSEIQGQGC